MNSKLVYLQFISFLVLITYNIVLINCMPEKVEHTPINCSIQRKCSLNEDIVWATVNNQCHLFRNPCIFANEKCLLKDKNMDELKVVTQDECKKYCHEFCTDEYAPVCGAFDNAYTSFPNKCEFLRHSCQNNQSYIFLQNGECDKAVAA